MTEDNKGFFGKDTADTIEGISVDFQLARDALPDAWADIKRMTADGIVALDKKTGLENVTDANTATILGAKAGITKGIWGGPIIGIKAAIVGALTARILMTSNIRDVRKWADRNCTPVFHGPPTADGVQPMAFASP